MNMINILCNKCNLSFVHWICLMHYQKQYEELNELKLQPVYITV